MIYKFLLLIPAAVFVLFNAKEIPSYSVAENIDKKPMGIRTDTAMGESRVEGLIFARNGVPRRRRCNTPQRRKTTEQLMMSLPDRNVREFRREKRKRGKAVLSECPEGEGDGDDDGYEDVKKSKKFDDGGKITNFCSLCNVNFRFDSHYLNHCEREHGDGKPYRCPKCKKGYKFRKSVNKHLKNEHFGVVQVTNDRMTTLRCRVCGNNIKGYKGYEKHCLTKHEGVKLMGCSKCPNKFYRRSALLKHVRRVHSDEDLKCKHCRNIFERTDFVKEHEEFCSQRQMQKRMGQEELNLMKKNNVRNTEILCEECREEVPSIAALKDHYRTAHPESKLYQCYYCEAAFCDGKSLHKHLDMRHTEKDANMEKFKRHRRGICYTCPHCREKFMGVAEYERHAKQHPGKPLFHCLECGKGYAFRHSLRDHVNEKHNDNKIICSYCSKCYFKLSRLRKHEEYCIKKLEKKAKFQAEGLPYYYCHICRKNLYVKKISFEKHLYRHQSYENCPVCGDRFHRYRNSAGLVEHFRVRHPLQENIRALLQTVKCMNEKLDEGKNGEDLTNFILTVKDKCDEGEAANDKISANFKKETKEDIKILI